MPSEQDWSGKEMVYRQLVLHGSWHNKLFLSRTRVLIELIEHNLLNLNALFLARVFILLRKYFMRNHLDNYCFSW